MAAYLSLKSKRSGKVFSGRGLIELDKRLCKALKVPCSDEFFYRGWLDSVGFMLAYGKSWDEIRNLFKDNPELLKVTDYLERHYINDSYFGR